VAYRAGTAGAVTTLERFGLLGAERVPTVDLHQRDMLRLACLDGARVWQLDDEMGTLTPGKQPT
jgi:cytosine/adenosine deaminase-related metal-dependent hydrolase